MGPASVCNVPNDHFAGHNEIPEELHACTQTGQKATQKHLHHPHSVVVVLLLVVLTLSIPFRWFALQLTSSTSSPRTFCIGTDFPTSDKNAEEGIPLEIGANLAITRHESDDLASGYTLKYCNKDDVSATTRIDNPKQGVQNIQELINNPTVVGMVGPANSDVAQAEIPVAARAGLPIVGPDTTDLCLTLQRYCGAKLEQVHPHGFPSSFFRICGNHLQQANAMYYFFKNKLHLQTVFIVDDGEIYGREIAEAFVNRINDNGGSVVEQDTSKDKTYDQLGPLAMHIASSQPDAVLYAGATANGAGQLKELLDKAKFSGPLIGGADIANDKQFLEDVGSVTNNTYGIDLGPDPSKLNPDFIKEYKSQYGEGPNSDSAKGYDAAMILITAIKNLIKNEPKMVQDNDIHKIRRAVLAILQDPKFQYQSSATGLPIKFDSNGDNEAQKTFVVYAVKNGQWVYKPDDDYPLSG